MKLKTYTIDRWCELFGLEIVDNDGFKGIDLNRVEVGLDLFLEGITICTINPTDKEKYKILDFLIKNL